MEAKPKTAAERKHAQRMRERGLDPEALSKAKQLTAAQREEQRKENETKRKENETKRAQQDADRKEIDAKRKRVERARSSEAKESEV
jgi:hypothetical protein